MSLLYWPSIQSPGRNPSHNSIAGLISEPVGYIGAESVYSDPTEIACAAADLSKAPTQAGLMGPELELRKRLVVGLMNYVKYDFHPGSETHLYFAEYAKASLVRSFHPFRAKAFEIFLLLANRLAMQSADGDVRSWINYVESKNGAPTAGSPFPNSDEFPCSGVVNFRLTEKMAARFSCRSDELALSQSKLASVLFANAIPELKEGIRMSGLDSAGINIRRFAESQVIRNGALHTVRIDKRIHALLIALGRELSVPIIGLASFIVDRAIRESVNNGFDELVVDSISAI